MTIDNVMLRVAAALGNAEIHFMLVGGFSSNYHGIARSTQDVDFVVQLNAPLSDKFVGILGQDFEPEAQLSFETKTGTQRQEFRVTGTLFKVEIFRLSEDVSVQGDKLDWNYVYGWCDRHGTREKLDEIRRTVPKV